jgi:hypothetical protein
LEEVNYDPELEELLRMIEQDAMRFNKSYGNMKASIVKTFEPISESYLLERLIFIGLMTSGKLTMFGSATKFKITPYGKMRAEDDSFHIRRICLWGWRYVHLVLIMFPFVFIKHACLYFFMMPIIRGLLYKFFIVTLLIWGLGFVVQIFVSCKKPRRRIGKIIMSIKEREKDL